jgi:thiol-disulfide isomerase/thioredoxin
LPINRRAWVLGLLALSGALPRSEARAQGFEFQPWDARIKAPAFAHLDVQGQLWRLEDLKGRVVLINFWASWCPPCLSEMPSLQTLVDLYGTDKLTVLAVNFKQSVPVIESFVKRTALQLPVLPDPQGQVARQWGVKVFPTTVLVGADGRLRGVVRGELDWTGSEANRLLQPLF